MTVEVPLADHALSGVPPFIGEPTRCARPANGSPNCWMIISISPFVRVVFVGIVAGAMVFYSFCVLSESLFVYIFVGWESVSFAQPYSAVQCKFVFISRQISLPICWETSFWTRLPSERRHHIEQFSPFFRRDTKRVAFLRDKNQPMRNKRFLKTPINISDEWTKIF